MGVPKSRWKTPPSYLTELKGFLNPDQKPVMAYLLDICGVQQTQHNNIKKKEHEELEKYQELKEAERMWKMKATVEITGALRAVTPPN